MAEVRKQVKQGEDAPKVDAAEEWDGTGNRRLAVHSGDADQELVQDGLTQVPLEYRGK